MVYVGNRHSATVTQKAVLPFRCVHCGREAKAVVVGVGQGQGNSAYFIDESGAKDRAASSAQSAAQKNALLTLELAVCPGCGKRNESAMRALKKKAFAGTIACVVLFPLLGILFDALMRGHIGLYVFVPTGLLAAWGVWRTQAWKWSTVDNRVAFI